MTEAPSPLRAKVRTIILFLAGFLWGVCTLFVVGGWWLKNNIIIERESPYDFPTTCEHFQKKVATMKGWDLKNVPCQLPQTPDSARIWMCKLCHTGYVGDLVSIPASRIVATFIPCQFAIYERDGKTYVARLNVGLISILLGDPAQNIFINGILPEQQNLMPGAQK